MSASRLVPVSRITQISICIQLVRIRLQIQEKKYWLGYGKSNIRLYSACFHPCTYSIHKLMHGCPASKIETKTAIKPEIAPAYELFPYRHIFLS